MDDLIYSLNTNDGYSGEYYNRIKLVSKEIINSTIRWGEHYIKDFMKFIEDNKIEKIRSIEEYSIEFMLIGVIFQEYIDNARALKKIPITPIILLNNLKNKKERKEDKIADIREWISNKILLRSKHQGDEYSCELLPLIEVGASCFNDLVTYYLHRLKFGLFQSYS